jgi:hypothetical protein
MRRLLLRLGATAADRLPGMGKPVICPAMYRRTLKVLLDIVVLMTHLTLKEALMRGALIL